MPNGWWTGSPGARPRSPATPFRAAWCPSTRPLYKFAGVLTGKLKNTLGLFISINGFSPECTAARSEALKAMILMNGADLNAILDDRIDLHEMLYRKRRHASQTGDIYLPVDKILLG
jgi:hypothetical protein